MKIFTMQYTSALSRLRSFSLAILLVGFTSGISFANGPDGIRLSGYPGSFSSLQAALSQAKSGDEVILPSGTYGESVVVRSGVLLNPEGPVQLSGLSVNAPGEVVRLGGDISIAGVLDMQEGLLDVGGYRLRASQVSGGNPKAYVVAVQPGVFEVAAREVPVVVPVGTLLEYLPETASVSRDNVFSLLPYTAAGKTGSYEPVTSDRVTSTCTGTVTLAFDQGNVGPYCMFTDRLLTATLSSSTGPLAYEWEAANPARADFEDLTTQEQTENVQFNSVTGSATFRVTVTDNGNGGCTATATKIVSVATSLSTLPTISSVPRVLK